MPKVECVVRRIFTLLLSITMVSCGQPAHIEVKDVWARDTVGSTANAAVFMTITSPAADRLMAASAPVAKKTDLMTMRGATSAMEMAYVEPIELPGGKPVSLNPAGLHVWLAGLNEPLRAGQSFPLTLEFENAGRREVTVAVIAPAAPPPMAGMKM
jgi:copper(I)-binding protein